MDYESIRQKNIARNEKLIAELFGIVPVHVDGANFSDETAQSRYVFHYIFYEVTYSLTHWLTCSQQDSIVTECVSNDDISIKLDDIIAKYPHLYRSVELKELMCYLDVNHTPAPPLHVVGPMGTGKTLCCRLVCNLYHIPCVYINCKGPSFIHLLTYSLTRSFTYLYRVYWHEIVYKIDVL